MTRLSADPVLPRTDVVVRDVAGLYEMERCELLYAQVMGLRPGDGSINPRLLIALQHNGGYVIGAFQGSELVGFTYSFLATDPTGRVAGPYQYSQLTVVAAHAQGLGVGRRLKHAQRDRALAAGLDRIRWAYDPVRSRNAHFNLDVLGGVVTQMIPAMYGARGFGDDADGGTDRFIVDWLLTPTPVRTDPATELDTTWSFGSVTTDGDDILIPTPASWHAFRDAVGATQAARLRQDLSTAFDQTLRSDRAAVSCRRVSDEVAVYRFSPQRVQAAR